MDIVLRIIVVSLCLSFVVSDDDDAFVDDDDDDEDNYTLDITISERPEDCGRLSKIYDIVDIHYELKLKDGTVVDSRYVFISCIQFYWKLN